MAAKREPTPVLAVLIRTGVVYPGGITAEGGLGYAPGARELTVGGVTEFGKELLDELRAEETASSGPVPPWQSERAANRAFLKGLRRTLGGAAT